MKALTFNQYRITNIFILSLIFFIAETLITRGAREWFPELPYVLSLNILFMSLEFMRWRAFGAISAIVGGVAFCMASRATPGQYAVYCLGNLMAAAVLIYIKYIGRKKVRDKVVLTVIYVTLIFAAACLGRFLTALILGADLKALLAFVTTDILSWMFALIGVLAARNAEGLFEDQKDYLMRLEKEKQEVSHEG
ncbi:MAG: hypothetical protein K6G81_02140 [Lachnospiraceae bacterium]|nr:hypothetical protein [Lachnospiraceae bacterium]